MRVVGERAGEVSRKLVQASEHRFVWCDGRRLAECGGGRLGPSMTTRDTAVRPRAGGRPGESGCGSPRIHLRARHHQAHPQGLISSPTSAPALPHHPQLPPFRPRLVPPEIGTTMVSGISRSPCPCGTDLAYTARRSPTGLRSSPLHLFARDQGKAAQVPPRHFARE